MDSQHATHAGPPRIRCYTAVLVARLMLRHRGEPETAARAADETSRDRALRLKDPAMADRYAEAAAHIRSAAADEGTVRLLSEPTEVAA